MVELGSTPQIYAASIGIQDSIFLMLLALIVFGPRRLPEIGRQIGKLMYEFRKVSNDFKFQMEEELRTHEEAERQKKLQAALPAAVAPAPVAELETAAVETPVAVEEIPVGEVGPEVSAAPAVDTHAAAESAPEVAEASPATEIAGIQIQPPTTGEQVAAARPFRAKTVETVAPAEAAEVSAGESQAGDAGETRHG